MSDQDSAQQEKVDLLLENLWEGNQDWLREYSAFMYAGEQFLAETRRGGDIRRLQTLRQAVEKPRGAMRKHYEAQNKRCRAIADFLANWRSPGQAYERFVDQAVRLVMSYSQDMEEARDTDGSITAAIEAFDAFLKAAR
jgi:hypothetical protein